MLPVVIGWVGQLVLILSGNVGSANGIHLDVYAASAVVFPVLVVAAFVEFGALSGTILRAGFGWRVASIALPASAGEIASMYALAYHKSTNVIWADTWFSLLLVTSFLVSNVIAHPDSSEQRTNPGGN